MVSYRRDEMARWCRTRVVAGLTWSGCAGIALFASCSALVTLPEGRVDVSDAGVFVELLGASVSVVEDRGLVDSPGIRFDVHGSVETDF